MNSIIEIAVQAAISNYALVHPMRSVLSTKVETSEETIRKNITKSNAGNLARNNRASRAQRKAVVNSWAIYHNVKFAVDRDTHYRPGHLSTKGDYMSSCEEVNPKGGRVMAYRLVEDGGKFYTEYAVAICREDEAFDPLMGKEVALAKFISDEDRKTQAFTPRPPRHLFDKR
jgi:hypothetical protein